MGMENYNPPQDPWLIVLYQDDHIMVVNKPSGLLSVPGRLEEHKVPRARAEKAVCGPRLGASIPCGRSGGSAADLRLAKPPETESLLRNR